ncbi:MAG: lipopolysaccharide heptosyltransferase II [Alcanivoracaceae bacterium]|nr:lipopolysaccharide heptosyltransferase II [Alcanivoracaceae bacterium]
MSASTPRRILVIGPSWVGDMVMAQTLFSALHQRHPGCVVDVLAPDWSRPILDRMPEVNRALSLPFAHGELRFGERRGLGRQLRDQYDQSIVLPNSLKSALLPWWARVPVRTGWRGEMRYGLLNDLRLLDKDALPLMVQRFVALALPPDAPVPALADISAPHLQVDPAEVSRALSDQGLQQGRPVTALCPGAEFGPAKRWPERHYAAVAAARIAAGGQVWIFGSGNDVPVAEAIRDAVPDDARANVHVLAGRTSLAQAVDLMSCADAVVTNDSGLMHIAAALGRPLVAVYGSTSPAFTPPLGEQVEVVRLGLSCSPCFERECPLGHLDCLNTLEPRRVLDALERLQGGH